MRIGFAIVLLTSLALALGGRGDEPAPKDAEQKERLETMKRQAADYEVALAGSTPVKLSLHAEPLLRFSNPVGGVVDGVVVMWKDGARPAVFAQIFQLKDGLWIHEAQSTAAAGLTMKIGTAIKWKPERAASNFHTLPDGPRAAEDAVKRLVQMKALAGKFAVAEDFKANAGDRETSRYQLRILPTPAYRYSDAKAGINDGAVFAFVHGTDPEVFLILEHRGDGDKAAWYYSLVPMTCWAVAAELGGREVWTVPERVGKSKADEPYHVWVHRPGGK